MAALDWVGVLACILTVLCVSATPSPVLGSTCRYDGTCTTPNSYCQLRTHQCTCKSGYVQSNTNDECVSAASDRAHMGDPCETAEDCATTLQAARCSENKVCQPCSEGSERLYSECTERAGCAYHEYDNVCWPYRRLGEDCTNDEDCWIKPNFNKRRHCMNKMCQCKPEYVMMSGPLPDGVVDQCVSPGSGFRTVSSTSLIVTLVSLTNYFWFAAY